MTSIIQAIGSFKYLVQIVFYYFSMYNNFPLFSVIFLRLQTKLPGKSKNDLFNYQIH